MRFSYQQIGLLLFIGLIEPFTANFNLHYFILLLALSSGFRSLLRKPGRFITSNSTRLVYNLSRIAFIYLLFLSCMYLVNMQYADNHVTERGFFAQMNYSILYALIFIYMTNYIIDGAIYSTKVYNTLLGYVVIKYISHNLIYSFQSHGVVHSAALGCFGLILLTNTLDKLLFRKNRIIVKLILLIQLVVLVVMPIMAYLRGSTIGLVLIIGLYFTYQLFTKGNVKSNKVLSALIIILTLTIAVIMLIYDGLNYMFKQAKIVNVIIKNTFLL